MGLIRDESLSYHGGGGGDSQLTGHRPEVRQEEAGGVPEALEYPG